MYECEIVEISHNLHSSISCWIVSVTGGNLSSSYQAHNTYSSFREKDISGTWGSVISLSVTIKRKCNYKCGALQASALQHMRKYVRYKCTAQDSLWNISPNALSPQMCWFPLSSLTLAHFFSLTLHTRICNCICSYVRININLHALVTQIHRFSCNFQENRRIYARKNYLLEISKIYLGWIKFS